MFNKEIYKVWAPFGKKWVDWVRPVPFIGIGKDLKVNEIINYEIPEINYLNECNNDTAIIIDIDSVECIKEGIALAYIGYRPIPIFNGTNPPLNSTSVTDNKIVEEMLIWGAIKLKEIKIKDDASPVFLLDKNRLNRYKFNRGVFDNSWDIYPQDVPSATYLLNNGIKKIIIKSDKLNNDLSKVLYNYYKNNIKIYFTDGYNNPKEIKIKKPKKIEL